MVLIEYEYKDTAIHALSPISKLVWFASSILLLTLYMEPQPLPILLTPAILIGYLSRISWKKLASRAWWAFVGSIFAGFTVSLWISPQQLWRIPIEFGSKPILVITPENTPVLGYTAVTYAGLLWGIAATLKIALAIIYACILSYTTPISDIVSLASKGLPYQLSFVIMAGVRFYPVLVERIHGTIDAAKSRGWEITSRNPFKWAREVQTVLFPSVREAMFLSDRMGLAVEARAFGVRKPTPLRRISLNKIDWLFMIMSILYACMMGFAWGVYGFGKL